MVKSICVASLLMVSLGLSSSPVAAQSPSLADIIMGSIPGEFELAPPPSGQPSHESHFLPEGEIEIAHQFHKAIVSQISTFPIGSSAGGLTYTFDSALGTFRRSAPSFGPAFADRAATVGSGKLSVGMNFQRSNYNSFEGLKLDDGSIKFYLTHRQIDGSFSEGDLLQTSVKLNLTTRTTSLFANYGISDRAEVGVIVPVVSVDLKLSVDATILRLATGDTGPTSQIHTFPGGATTQTSSAAGSATGIGDVLVRAKYRLYTSGSGGVAAGLDLRLPSGDKENLLGTGTTQAKLAFIASKSVGKAAPHVNVGYTFTRAGASEFFQFPDEVTYAGGVEIFPTPRVTIVGDFIGRTLRGTGRLQLEQNTFSFKNAAGVAGSKTFSQFAYMPGSLNLGLGAAGAKFNPTGNMIISLQLLFPLTDAGIRASVTPVLGVDYTF